MCDVVNIWLIKGEEVSQPCTVDCKGTCHYDQKVADGLMEPSVPQWDEPQDRMLIRKERGGEVLWALSPSR